MDKRFYADKLKFRDNVVIVAGSIVNRDTTINQIWAGNPARF